MRSWLLRTSLQVSLAEGERLGIECADLRGRKGERNPAEEGRFLTGTATGVSVYSNLFNVKPLIKGCDFLVFDDAHGGEQYVSGMWTVSIGVEETPELYNEVLVALKPVLSESQIRSLLDRSASSVELADVWSDVGVLPKLAGVLEEGTENTNLAYPWWMIRNRLHSCLVLLSSYEITLRPYVAPTHTHDPFVAAKQRVYMSATLGGESDLQRAYGIQKLAIVRAQGAQWGKRYVFIPQLYTDRGTSVQILASVWDRMKTRRAVILAPSDRAMNGAFQTLSREMSPVPMRMLAADITDTLDA